MADAQDLVRWLVSDEPIPAELVKRCDPLPMSSCKRAGVKPNRTIGLTGM